MECEISLYVGWFSLSNSMEKKSSKRRKKRIFLKRKIFLFYWQSSSLFLIIFRGITPNLFGIYLPLTNQYPRPAPIIPPIYPSNPDILITFPSTFPQAFKL